MIALTERQAAVADHEAYCRLLPELGTGDPPPTLEAWTSQRAAETFFLEAAGAVVATAWTRTLGRWGHVVQVIVDPAWRGRGVGRRLMHAAADRLRRAGCTHWYLNVKRENTAALRLYASVGLGERVESAALKIPWSIVPALPAAEVPPPAAVLPAEDEGIEARFSLVPGSVTAGRARGELPIRIGDPARALAVFNPSFPGAWCFRADDASLVRPLLDALRPHAPAAVPHVMAMTEDPGVTSLLLAHGAELRMELYRLSGTIPRL